MAYAKKGEYKGKHLAGVNRNLLKVSTKKCIRSKEGGK
jgi:hypothetical protein